MVRVRPSGIYELGPSAGGDRSLPVPVEPSLPIAALDLMSDAVIGLGEEQEITYCNSAAESLYKFSRGEVIGSRFSDIVEFRAADASESSLLPSIQNPGLTSGPAVHRVRSGIDIDVRVTLFECGLTCGPHRMIAIVRDDREHVRLMATLQEELAFERLVGELSARFSSLPEDKVDDEIEVWLRRLVEFLHVDRSSFAELTPQGVLVTHSYAAPGIEPYPKAITDGRLPWIVKEMMGRRNVILSKIPDDLPAEAAAERAYCRLSGWKSGAVIPLHIGGELICVLTLGCFRGQRDWPAATIARLQLAGHVFANAIVRRQAKQRLVSKQNELAHFGRVASMAELASVIAHELDQPLTAVVSNAQAIRYLLHTKEPDLVEVDAALNDVVDAAMRVSQIVRRERQLLRKSEVKVEAVNLSDLIREIELFIRAEARQDGVRVSLELLPDLPMVMADRVSVQQVILNVARNALQAMHAQPPGHRLLTIRTSFRAAIPAGQVEVSVIDAGPPVEDTLLQQMFEPFFSTKPNGLGMGLSIARTIVESQHGQIRATRNAGHGITMLIAFPQIEAEHV